MGRRIERSLNAIRLLQGTLVDVMHQEAPLLEAVLEIADSAMTYRRRYLTSLQVHAVLDLLVCDETNPRSIAFQMAAMAEHVDHLPHATDGSPRTPEQQILIRCLTGLRLIDIESESAEVVGGQRVKVREVLGVVSDHLAALSDSIGHSYFSHATLSRHANRGRRRLPPREGRTSAMRYQVTHITNYLYNDTVAISQNIAHLRPRKCDRQSWLRTDLAIDPWPAVLSERLDFFGNSADVLRRAGGASIAQGHLDRRCGRKRISGLHP